MNQVPDIYITQNFNGTLIGEGNYYDIGQFAVEALQEYFEKMTLGEREFMQMDACYRRDLKKS